MTGDRFANIDWWADDEDDDELLDASVDTFITLMQQAPRTYVDLIALTGVNYRTAKKLMRTIGQTQKLIVAEQVNSNKQGRRPKMFSLARPIETPAPPSTSLPPQSSTTVIAADVARIPASMPLVLFAVEIVCSDADLIDVDGLVAAVADFIGWRKSDLSKAIESTTGMSPIDLQRWARNI